MKTIYYIINAMKSILHFKAIKGVGGMLMLVLLTISISFTLQSCLDNDDIEDNFYTFTGDLAGKYLQNHPEKFSEFTKILDTTGIMGLLNAYGTYTVFAPTNEAMHAYYKSKGRVSYSQMPYDSLEIFAKNHIIKDFKLAASSLTNGQIPYASMNKRYIMCLVTVDENNDLVIKLNKTSPILGNDTVHNGIVYTIGEALHPSDLFLHEEIEANPKFSYFYDALATTGLIKLIEKNKDESYVPDPRFINSIGDWGGWKMNRYQPDERLFRYTALIESNATYEANGYSGLSGLKKLAKEIYDPVYPQDKDIDDVKDRRNSLNRFVAYHLLDKGLTYNKFIYDLAINGCPTTASTGHVKSYDMYEYLETMCPNTLLEVRTNKSIPDWHGSLNVLSETGKGVNFVTSNVNNQAVNGFYHEIDGILAYTSAFKSELTSKRLRFDISAFFPELVNNDMRMCKRLDQCFIPEGYIANLTQRNTDGVWYLPANDKLMNYQLDEIFVVNKLYESEVYDLSITTYPIPAGQYEVRVGYLTNGGRGVAQYYLDSVACGIPLDMNPDSKNVNIGWVDPSTTPEDPLGLENDKMMHNRGYMKGPASVTVVNFDWAKGADARLDYRSIRRVLGIYTFGEDGKHEIRVKSIGEYKGQLELDWFEFVPVEYLPFEGID